MKTKPLDRCYCSCACVQSPVFIVEGKKLDKEIEHVLVIVVEFSLSGYSALNLSCSLWGEIHDAQPLTGSKRL